MFRMLRRERKANINWVRNFISFFTFMILLLFPSTGLKLNGPQRKKYRKRSKVMNLWKDAVIP
jgi:hypothetical protein